ncbi:KH domain-containing protein [archaeon]|jgi:exosome complex component RRP4|nr:KH domain-containing protein [archaeon]MBT4397814.1 KH domain-containing protein [archaeon]MBT4441148.1 KH domain-containing protein [archaeon]
MSNLLIEDKQVVVPGDILAEGMDYLPSYGTQRVGEQIIAMQVGLANVNGRVIKIISLNGRYIPKKDDTVIGYVSDSTYSSWFVDVGYAYDGSLSLKDATSDFIERGASLSKFFKSGDIVLIKITNVTREKAIDLSMKGPGLRKLTTGKVIEISPSKVPRVVGKQGSMISMIKEKTGCSIFAGQNGRIWIKSEDPVMDKLATDAILLIEQKSHVSGLTDLIKEFLEQNVKEKKK